MGREYRIVAARNRRPVTVERPVEHTLHHPEPHVLDERLAWASKTIKDSVDRVGYAEALWVAEALGFEYAVQWRGEDALVISLEDLQLVAFAAAMRAHHEVITLQLQGPLSAREKHRLKRKTERRKDGRDGKGEGQTTKEARREALRPKSTRKTKKRRRERE